MCQVFTISYTSSVWRVQPPTHNFTDRSTVPSCSADMQSPLKRSRQDQGPNSTQQQQQEDAQQQMTSAAFRDLAVSFLCSRLVVSQANGPQAASMQLRPSLQKVQEELLSIISSAVQLKQNASLMILGEPGIGKTLALERALRAAVSRFNSDSSNPTLGVVRLSGALHCDERSAFQEIAHQLCSTFSIPFSRSASFDDNLAFFKEVLAELHRAFKTVVFVIDQVDAFVRACKQTLLYNVLDALTSSQVQAVVFGVSCAYDVQDSMEKRVRSRFSNRKIFLPGLGSAKDGAESAAGILSSMLLLPDDYQPLFRSKQHNSCVHRAMDSQPVKAALQELVAVGVTPRELSTVALTALTSWQGGAGQQAAGLQPQHVAGAVRAWLGQHDSRVAAVCGLSVLELCMLVAAQRLEDAGVSVFNFQMVLDEFMSVQQMQLGHMWNRAAAWRAFKDLVDQGLMAFLATRPGSRGLMQRYLPAQLRVAKGELQRALQQHSSCPSFVPKWLRGDTINSCMLLA